ncbi:MAG: hypothetical protein WC496_00070 [Phycisphaerae bacterium]|jgi:hypothetical protein
MDGNTIKSVEMPKSNTECYTIQPDQPFKCSPKRHDAFYKAGQIALPCLLIVLYIALFAFMLIMMYRFVRAVERIAKKFENGITINKNNSNLDDKV